GGGGGGYAAGGGRAGPWRTRARPTASPARKRKNADRSRRHARPGVMVAAPREGGREHPASRDRPAAAAAARKSGGKGAQMFHVVLVEPEIPANTGNIGRLCLATGATLHLVGRPGFHLDDRHLRRAGLD